MVAATLPVALELWYRLLSVVLLWQINVFQHNFFTPSHTTFPYRQYTNHWIVSFSRLTMNCTSMLANKRSNFYIVEFHGVEHLHWLLLTAILATVFAYWTLQRSSRRNMLASKLPGAPTLPLIGNAHIFIGIDILGKSQNICLFVHVLEAVPCCWCNESLLSPSGRFILR